MPPEVVKERMKMKCKCIEAVNKALRTENAELATSLSLDFDSGKASVLLPVPVRKRDTKSRKKLPTVLATNCPFCGKKCS